MYRVVCFVLLVSLEGLNAENNSSTTEHDGSPEDTMYNLARTRNTTQPSTIITTKPSTINTTKPSTIITTKPSTVSSTTEITTTSKRFCITSQMSDGSNDGCLINLNDKKEMALWGMIALLLIICFLLLVIITCLTCKCCQGARKNKMVVMKSLKRTSRNSVNGVPSENDTMLKDCSSVKVENETTQDESPEPEEVGGAYAEVEYQVPTEENQNPENDTAETAPTEEVDQSGETDLKMDDVEKAE